MEHLSYLKAFQDSNPPLGEIIPTAIRSAG